MRGLLPRVKEVCAAVHILAGTRSPQDYRQCVRAARTCARSEAGGMCGTQALSALVTEAMKDAHSKSVDVRSRAQPSPT